MVAKPQKDVKIYCNAYCLIKIQLLQLSYAKKLIGTERGIRKKEVSLLNILVSVHQKYWFILKKGN